MHRVTEVVAAAMDGAPVGFGVIDAAERVVYSNPAREVAEAAADAGVEALDARAAAVLVLRGDVLDITAGRGYPAALLDAWNPLSLDQDTPVCRSARENRPQFVPTPGDMRSAYPS